MRPCLRLCDTSFRHVVADKGEAEKLEVQVEEARTLLSEYNSRLSHELEERKRVARMLRDFIHAQKEALTESENRLQVGEHRIINAQQSLMGGVITVLS